MLNYCFKLEVDEVIHSYGLKEREQCFRKDSINDLLNLPSLSLCILQVALLQETVKRECEEREELTAALSQAQEELLGLRSLVSHQGSMERDTPPENNHFQLHRQARLPLTRSSAPPNTLRPSPACIDKDGGRGTNVGGAGRSLESWNCGGVLGGEKRQKGTLPRLKASSTVSEVKRKVSLVMERKETL